MRVPETLLSPLWSALLAAPEQFWVLQDLRGRTEIVATRIEILRRPSGVPSVGLGRSVSIARGTTGLACSRKSAGLARAWVALGRLLGMWDSLGRSAETFR